MRISRALASPFAKFFDSVFALRDALLAAGAKVPIKLPQIYVDELKKGDDAKGEPPTLERSRGFGRERTLNHHETLQKPKEEKRPEPQPTIYPPLSVEHAREKMSQSLRHSLNADHYLKMQNFSQDRKKKKRPSDVQLLIRNSVRPKIWKIPKSQSSNLTAAAVAIIPGIRR